MRRAGLNMLARQITRPNWFSTCTDAARRNAERSPATRALPTLACEARRRGATNAKAEKRFHIISVRNFSYGGGRSNRQHYWKWVAIAATGVGSGFLFSLSDIGRDAVQSEHTQVESITMRVAALVRGARTLWTVVLVGADYKLSLRGLERKSVEYKEALSACHQRSAERVLELCRRQAGVYIKAGQHISSLRPVIPSEFTDTLSCLCDDAPQSQLQHVRRIVREEFGVELEEAFESFDLEPIGCASLAQVHRAVLRSGRGSSAAEARPSSGEDGAEPPREVVAVKVQHIWMSLHTQSDLLAMEWAAWALEAAFKGVQVGWILPLFRTNLEKELDFRKEAANSVRCADNFRGDTTVKIPSFVPALTSRRVLTMEFIEGVRVDDVARLQQRGFDPPAVGNAVTRVFGEMVFSHGFVHCDPHPGNLLVRAVPAPGGGAEAGESNGQRNGKEEMQIVVLDHGLYREIEGGMRRAYCELWEAMVLQDKAKLEAVSEAMGVGAYAALFPLIFTSRGISSATPLGQRLSTEDRRRVTRDLGLRTDRGMDVTKVLHFVESLPRDLLFIIRTQNLVRALCSDLGYPSRMRFRTYARLAAKGTLLTDAVPPTSGAGGRSLGLRVRQWARWLNLEVRMLLIEAGIWFSTSIPWPREATPAPGDVAPPST